MTDEIEKAKIKNKDDNYEYVWDGIPLEIDDISQLPRGVWIMNKDGRYIRVDEIDKYKTLEEYPEEDACDIEDKDRMANEGGITE